MKAVISGDILSQIAMAARAAYPEECCGFLMGSRTDEGGWRIDSAIAAQNVATDRHHRFEIDPALHLRLQRELRGSGRAVVGHYHSHPNGRAEPSATDLAVAQDPGLLWVIVAIHGEDTALAAFSLKNGAFQTVTVPPD